MNIAIAGSGNVAHVLARQCRTAGHKVVQVHSRNAAVGQALAQEVRAQHQPLPLPELHNIHICIIAVADDAITAVAADTWQSNTIVVHTAGAVPIHSLAGAARRCGVLYPLQSLTAHKKNYAPLPFFVDGNSTWVKNALLAFAHSLSPRVQLANDAQRLHYHLAAVVVSNFTNHLYTLAYAFCREKGLEFAPLLPLIDEVTQRLHHYPPHLMQTGPAKRGDKSTIARHLQLLHNNQSLYDLYGQFSAAIEDFYGNQAQKSPAVVQTAGPMASNS